MSPTTSHKTRVANLYREQHDHLSRRLRRKFPKVDDGLTEDACQFAWMQLLINPQVDDSYVLAWLTVVATNETLRLLSKHADLAADENPPEGTSPLSGPDVQAETRERVAAMRDLKPAQQVTLRLLAQGYTYEEIMDLTGKTYTWVNRHIAEGRAALRKRFPDY